MREDQTMKRKRHTEEQIIAILKEHEAGVKTADLCRKHGISEASFYNWKSKYGGLEVSDAKRLKGLESENARLKKLLADAMLDNATRRRATSCAESMILVAVACAIWTPLWHGLGPARCFEHRVGPLHIIQFDKLCKLLILAA